MSEPVQAGRPWPGRPLPDDAVAPVRAPSAPAPGERIEPHYAWCFGCGADHPDGLRLTARAGAGVSAVAHATVTGAHQGAPGLAHGGIIAALMDEAQGLLHPLLGAAAVTGTLEVAYRRPVPIGTEVTARAECVGVAGRKIYTAAGLYDDAGTLLAESAGVFIVVGEAHFAPYLDRAAGSPAGPVGAADVAAPPGRRAGV